MSRLKTDAIRNVNASVDGITLDTSGNVAIPNELQLADKIVHTGDTNTAIRFPANDTITFETNGDQALEITSGGGVKFNDADTPSSTSAPAQILNHSGGWQFYGSSAEGTHRNIIFGTNDRSAGERFRITSAGNVLIGNTSGSEKLDVTGWIQSTSGFKTAGHPIATYASFTDISGGSYATRLGSTGSSTLRSTQIYGGGSHLATFDGVNTRLGIGKTAPSETLEIFKASGTNLVKLTTEANSTIGLEIQKTGSTTQSWRIVDGQTANGTLEIYDKTESETRLAIDGSGRVIIGQHNHSGGGALVVCGNSNTPNSYASVAFCKIQANPTSGTTLTNLRFSAGAGGTNRAAEINVQADSNWNDGTSQESKMIFTVASSGGGNTAGNPLMTLKGTGDVEINRGNLVIANNKGIDFSATGGGSGTSNESELLADYENGEWTPVLHHYISGGFSAPSYSAAGTVVGRYTKIGNIVHISASFLGFNISNAHGSSFARITGLPFTSINHPNNRDVISTCSDAFTTNGVNFSTYWNQTNLNSMKNGTGVFDWGVLSGGSAKNIVISGHYYVA